MIEYLKRFKFVVSVILTIVIFNPIISYSQKSFTDNNGYTYETVKGDPLKARIYKLDNGLTVYMTVYKDEPRIQTYIAVKTGHKNDPSDATGLAHYLEHQ
jgi:secreted Zn-dependent insulinase-like peptidase